jgi:hypothetical protein
VFAVKLRRDRVVVVLSTKVYVYRFSDLKLIDQISTVPNPKGIVSLCPDPSNNVLAIPGKLRPFYTTLLSNYLSSPLFFFLFFSSLLVSSVLFTSLLFSILLCSSLLFSSLYCFALLSQSLSAPLLSLF